MVFLKHLNSFFSHLAEKIQKSPKIYLYIPLGLYWVVLFLATTLPTTAMPQLFNAQDKLEHFAAYFLLGIGITISLFIQKKLKKLSQNVVLYSLLFLALYAGIDELHQQLIPGRFCDLYDWIADVIGGSLGVFLGLLFIKNYLHYIDAINNT